MANSARSTTSTPCAWPGSTRSPGLAGRTGARRGLRRRLAVRSHGPTGSHGHRNRHVSGIAGSCPAPPRWSPRPCTWITAKLRPRTLPESRPQSFDVVTCMELLEHVPDPARLVRSCAGLVRPGGSVLFSTINRTARSFATAIVGAEYLSGLVPRGTHRYSQLIRPSELDAWGRKAGLTLQSLRGGSYNPASRSLQAHRRHRREFLCPLPERVRRHEPRSFAPAGRLPCSSTWMARCSTRRPT